MDFYFQGRAWLNKGIAPANLTPAGNFLERALALDPDNVEALVATAYLRALRAAARLADDVTTSLSVAEENLNRALIIAPDYAQAHHALGTVYNSTKRAALGLSECEHALTLDRNLAIAYGGMGRSKLLLGRAEGTENHVLEALRLSPARQSAFAWMNVAGYAKLLLGRDEEAIVWLRRSIDRIRNLTIRTIGSPLVRLGLDGPRKQRPPRRSRANLIPTSSNACGRMFGATTRSTSLNLSGSWTVTAAGLPEG